jgi:hypothetical protein
MMIIFPDIKVTSSGLPHRYMRSCLQILTLMGGPQTIQNSFVSKLYSVKYFTVSIIYYLYTHISSLRFVTM